MVNSLFTQPLKKVNSLFTQPLIIYTEGKLIIYTASQEGKLIMEG